MVEQPQAVRPHLLQALLLWHNPDRAGEDFNPDVCYAGTRAGGERAPSKLTSPSVPLTRVAQAGGGRAPASLTQPPVPLTRKEWTSGAHAPTRQLQRQQPPEPHDGPTATVNRDETDQARWDDYAVLQSCGSGTPCRVHTLCEGTPCRLHTLYEDLALPCNLFPWTIKGKGSVALIQENNSHTST